MLNFLCLKFPRIYQVGNNPLSRMETQGIEPRPSPCKGDVLPLDYASVYFLCLTQNLSIRENASIMFSSFGSVTILIKPGIPKPEPLIT